MTQTSLPEPDADTLRGLGDLETIDLLIPDCNGLLRGKRINPSGLEKAYSAGICCRPPSSAPTSPATPRRPRASDLKSATATYCASR